ncbi:MAG: hypothetical protein GY915_03495 [bacterium]|nr:hypothetical protein [bacterium]
MKKYLLASAIAVSTLTSSVYAACPIAEESLARIMELDGITNMFVVKAEGANSVYSVHSTQYYMGYNFQMVKEGLGTIYLVQSKRLMNRIF